MRDVKDKRLSATTNYFLTGVAASASRLFVNPISATKIFMEVGAPGSKMGLTRAYYWMVKLHGFKASLGRGAGIAAVRLAPHYAIQFSVYDRIAQNWVSKPKGVCTVESLIATWIAGACGGVAATLVTHPLDVIKTRLVVQPSGPGQWYSGAGDAFGKILKNEGVYRGIYRGLGISIVGSACFAGDMFLFWELYDNLPWRRRGAPPYLMGKWEVYWGPAWAVTAAALVNHPLDVIRRKFMAQSYVLPREGKVDVHFRNVWQCVVQMYKLGGVFSFFNGSAANAIKMAPQLAMFTIVLSASQGTLGRLSGGSAVSLKR